MTDANLTELAALLTPIALTEEQGLFAGENGYRSPIARLLGAVLCQALRDILNPGMTVRRKRLRKRALAWVYETETAGANASPIVQFVDCCSAVELDPDALRKHLNRREKN